MRRVIVVSTALVLLAGSGAAGAQSRWSVEMTGGAAFATQKLGDADLGTGVGFEMNGRYRIMPHLAIYAGWDWHHFRSDQPLAGGDMGSSPWCETERRRPQRSTGGYVASAGCES